jgi:hypothetical protein
MRPGLFDESKIIKKEDQQKEIVEKSKEKLPELKEDEKIYNNEPSVTCVDEHTISKLEINKSEIFDKPNITQSQIQEKQKTVKSQPVFIFERDKNTKKVKTVNTIQSTTINIDIPADHLTLIYVNTIRRINEIKVDIEVLKLIISEKDNFYFNNKKIELEQELEFNNKKIEILKKLIEV